MSQVTSRSSIDHLDLNHSAFANNLPTYLHAKQSKRRGGSSAVQRQDTVRFYVSDDVENDVRGCIRSWEHRRSISVTGRTATGEIKCFSGTVETVARAPGLAKLWLVTMTELKPTSGLFDAGVGTAPFSTALNVELKVADPVSERLRNWTEEKKK
jgi:hypothetical protein